MNRLDRSAALGIALLALATGAGCTSPSTGGPSPGKPTLTVIGAEGGEATSSDGVLTVSIPPGALSGPTDVQIETVPSTAPAPYGNAYRLGPPGLPFLTPATLVFHVPASSLDQLSISYRAGEAYWLRPPLHRDPGTSTLSTTVTAFDRIEWSLVTVGPNTARDLAGTISMASTIGVPFQASGAAVLSFAGQGAGTSSSTVSYYFLDGTLRLTTPVMYGTTSCQPVNPPGDTVPLSNTALVEISTQPPRLVWALNAYWNLQCDNGSSLFVSTQFDTLGISLPSCSRGYVGTPIIGTDRVQCDGTIGCAYVIDCGVRGSTTATWNMSLCPGGSTCASSTPCHAASYSCATGYPVCVDAGFQPDGTDCSTTSSPDRVCVAGSCVSCVPGSSCTPAGACVEWTVASCSNGPVCSATSTPLANGLACGATSTCHGGACVPSRTVEGNRLVTFWQEDGSSITAPAPDVTPPPGNPPAIVSAFVQAGSSWVEYPGAFTADGHFTVPAVPDGPYQLVLVTGGGEILSVSTSASSVDLGYDVLGRPSTALAVSPTPVQLDLTNLASWASTDAIEIVSVGADLRDFPAGASSIPASSTAGSVVRDWASAPPLALLAPTDVLRAAQLSHSVVATASGSLDVLAASRSAVVSGVTLADGAPATIPVAFTDPATAGALTVDWSVTAFEALLPSMGPAAIVAKEHALLVGASFGQLGSPGPLAGPPVLLQTTLPPGSASVALATPLAYDQFLAGGTAPASWMEWRETRFEASLPVLASGALMPWNAPVTAGQRVAMATSATLPATPRLVPVGAPLWNATLDASSSQAAVGNSPVLSWTPPPGGAASYEVRIWRVSANASVPSETVATPVGRWSTTASSLGVPAGVLEAGATYVARIEARQGDGTDVTTAPWRSRAVSDWAGRLTATFSP